MTKYGVAIAQSGTPIEKASDYQRIIDTRWKTMSVVARVPFEVKDVFGSGKTVKIFDHNLGYIPAFEAPYFNTRYETDISHIDDYLFVADRTSIYFVVSPDIFFESGYNLSGNITVYDLNIETDYKAERAGLLGSVGRSQQGIKIIGNNSWAARDASDTDPIGFSITTDSKAIGVDQVGTVNITGGDPFGFTVLGRGVIQHELSYPPLVKTARMFSKNTNSKITNGVQDFPAPSTDTKFYSQLQLTYAKVESQRVVLQSYTNDTYRFILFKEPTDIAG